MRVGRPGGGGPKFFISQWLFGGLQPPDVSEVHRAGSISVGLETDWIPALDDGQRRIGFNGTKLEDLNKAPVLVRPVVRIGLPWKLTGVVAATPPWEAVGGTPHLLAFGLGRPLLELKQWPLSC